MNALFVTARAVEFASAMLLFGGLVFVFGVAQPAWRNMGHACLTQRQCVKRRLLIVVSLCVVASVASAAVWLAIETAVMTGSPLEQAMRLDTLALVLGKTEFGRVWALRFGLVIALWALLLAIGRSTNGQRASYLAFGAIAVAGAHLGTLAWAGHAAAGQGSDRLIQIVSDVVHLLAAGAWLGALPGLLLLLARTQPHAVAAQAARRFSTLGVVSVSALIVTGLANTWYLVGDVPALIGTDYGRLLMAKVALFLAMLTLAATNRWQLTPRLVMHEAQAQRSLWRNALLEIVAGIFVVIIVGLLGITVPAAHQPPVWPFDHTLSWEAAEQSAWVGTALGAAATVACAAAGAVLGGVRSNRPRLWLAGLAGMAAAAATCAWLLAVPAYPTTYVASPVRYNVEAIARGAALYAESCSTCHGRDGRGEGPVAASLSIKPAKLTDHASRRPGDLFWFIAHGKPQTRMPAFSPSMSDAKIWDLIWFLHAQADAEDAMSMTGHVQPWRPIVAPDFTFELPGLGQESLKEQRGRFNTLVVLYTLPQSVPVLRTLAAERHALAMDQVRIIALPASPSSTPANLEETNEGASIFPLTSPDLVATYGMFARVAAPKGSAPAHVEFLIDRQGYLRARWIGVPDDANDRMAEMRSQIDVLNDERLEATASERHGH